MTEMTKTEIEDAAFEKELTDALKQADRLIAWGNLMPKSTPEKIRQAHLDIERGEKVSLVWTNMSRAEKKIAATIEEGDINKAIGLLLRHVGGMKKVVIAQSYCNDHLVERIEALEAKVNRAPNKDAAEMRKAASMLYARAKQLEGE